MPKVALLSDVHGNRLALEAVLNDLPDVDDPVRLGDVVGYNSGPLSVSTAFAKSRSAVSMSNHDRVVETPDRCRANATAHAGLQLANERLSAETGLVGRPTRDDTRSGRPRAARPQSPRRP